MTKQEPNREFTQARQEQGFKSQAHLDAFYRHFDHTHSCPECGKPGPAYWLDGSASWQPTVTECEIGRQLFVESFGELFEDDRVAVETLKELAR